MIGKLIEIGKFYGMGMNAEKNQGNENLKGTITGTDYGRSETTENLE